MSVVFLFENVHIIVNDNNIYPLNYQKGYLYFINHYWQK